MSLSSMAIALSGLEAARTALDVVGDNIANVNTEGYHRQEVRLEHRSFVTQKPYAIGQGVSVESVVQIRDTFVERSIIENTSLYAQSARATAILRTIEDIMGDPNEGGITAKLSAFFDAWSALSVDPTSLPLRQQVLQSADVLATNLNLVSAGIKDKKDSLDVEIDLATAEVNRLTGEIAELNLEIKQREVKGHEANNLRDLREALLLDLAEKIDCEIIDKDFGDIAVYSGNCLLVSGSMAIELERVEEGAEAVIRSRGRNGVYMSDVGGEVGGLLAMRNDALPAIIDELDGLARTLISQVNIVHSQGVGTSGSFTSVRGTAALGLGDLVPPVVAGRLYVRVTDLVTGEVERYGVDVDPATDDLTSVAAALDALDGLNASAAGSEITISSDATHAFDFLPVVDAKPDLTGVTGTAAATIAGAYTGAAEETYTFTVADGGTVGVDDGVSVEVRKQSTGALVKTLSVGATYRPGDALIVGDGIKVAFSNGTLNAGDAFSSLALAESDTSHFLAATGVNTFFAGTDAESIQVSRDISQNVLHLAASSDGIAGDNANAVRISALVDASQSGLEGYTIPEYATATATRLGQDIFLKESQKDGREVVLEGLMQRRDDSSGVDVDKETVRMLEFQRMYQGVAKFLSICSDNMQVLMGIIR